MGLIKAAAGAVGGTLKDQWKEALRCDDMGNDILMKKVTIQIKLHKIKQLTPFNKHSQNRKRTSFINQIHTK